MTIFETIGYAWVILTSALGTAVIVYFAYRGAHEAVRHNVRGQFEERLDIKTEIEQNCLTRMAR